MKRPSGVCKDCWAEYLRALDDDPFVVMPRWRPAPKPGPRCVTHDRAEKARRKLRAHANKVESGFGIPAEVYWALYEFQGGKCAILHCRATGKTRRLAVDHDHKCCPGRTSCGKCVRGLLCNPHNEMFGRNGDDPDVFQSMAFYLITPPYVSFLNSQRRTQREQLDRHSGPGAVEKQGGTVRRYREDAGAIRPAHPASPSERHHRTGSTPCRCTRHSGLRCRWSRPSRPAGATYPCSRRTG
jgi:hypothetical protein